MIEYLISIIASLLKNYPTASKQRVLTKFVENDHEKVKLIFSILIQIIFKQFFFLKQVDRLMEIYFHYLEKINQVDDEIEKERADVSSRKNIYLYRSFNIPLKRF